MILIYRISKNENRNHFKALKTTFLSINNRAILNGFYTFHLPRLKFDAFSHFLKQTLTFNLIYPLKY